MDKEEINANLILQKLQRRDKLVKEAKTNTTSHLLSTVFALGVCIYGYFFDKSLVTNSSFFLLMALLFYVDGSAQAVNKRIDALIKLMDFEKEN
jgi:hypothetical protein